MLHNVLAIAILHIKLVVTNRSVFIFSLLMPLLFTVLLGNARIAGTADHRGQQQILVVNEDQGQLSTRLISTLKNDSSWQIDIAERSTARQFVARGKAEVLVIIPADFTSATVAGGNPSLKIEVRQPATQRTQVAEQFVNASVSQFGTMLQSARTIVQQEGTTNGPETQTLQRLIELIDRAEAAREQNPIVTVQDVNSAAAVAKRAETAGGVNHSSPGMLVMFSLLFMVSGTNILIMERRRGTLRRLLVMPISKFTILSGKMLGIYLTGIVQMALLIVGGAIFFGVDWGRSPVALILMVLSFAFVATSLGMLLATIARTVAQADALASLIVMAMSALGGAWWSLDLAPRWMRLAGHIFPTAWAMDGFQDIIVRGQTLVAVLPEIGALLGFTFLLLTLGLWRFRYE
jgi:ABC-2 type transport system permease protein